MNHQNSKPNFSANLNSKTPLDMEKYFPADFFQNYYQKKLLYLPNAVPLDKLHSIVNLDSLDELVRNNSFPLESIIMVRDGQPVREQAPRTNKGKPDYLKIRDELEEGSTFSFEGLDEASTPFKKLSEAISLFFGHPTMVNGYLTPANQSGFMPHIDGHDVLAIQIAGKKNWKIYNKYENGVERTTDHLKGTVRSQDLIPIEEDVDIYELNEGDMLYLPLGTMHAPYCTDELSFHLSIGIHPTIWADYLHLALEILMKSDPEFREYAPLRLKGSDQNFDTCSSVLQKLAKKLISLDPSEIEHYAFRKHLSSKGVFGHSLMADAVTKKSQMDLQDRSFTLYLAERADFRVFKDTKGQWHIWTLNHKCSLYKEVAQLVIELKKQGFLTSKSMSASIGSERTMEISDILQKIGIVGIRFD